MITSADSYYIYDLLIIIEHGEKVTTRNHEVFKINCVYSEYRTLPLITVRKTAWKKALQEMEWFMSGETRCPDNLRDWWDGQLDEYGHYHLGYPTQFRAAKGSYPGQEFDQVKFILEGLRNNPNSRRLVMTAWNPMDMHAITDHNDNPKTPTTCHSSMLQFFVADGKLDVFHYQRSADMLLGLPHNLVQQWALMMYFATHAGLEMGTLKYMIGDAHVYNDPSHTDVVKAMSDFALGKNADNMVENMVEMLYNFSEEYDESGVPVFKASDFNITGLSNYSPIPGLQRPKLF